MAANELATNFREQFKKVKLLGEGAFGAAYLVLKRDDNCQCVCKEVRITHLTQKEKDGALGESNVLRSVSHPNIVAYVDTFMDGSKLYIVMEYADGGDLACKIRDRKEHRAKLEKEGQEAEKGHFSNRRVSCVFLQIAKALQYIHSRKILHRDLKPMNIFLTKDGIIKLGDFGIARVLESSTAGAQTTIGTPFYLSPEQCNNEQYGYKSDLWSLGVVTYEMAALKVPFHAPSLPAVAMMICNAEFAPLPKMYSEPIVSVVTRLLAKDPVDRPGLEELFQEQDIKQYVQWYDETIEEYLSGRVVTPDDSSRTSRGNGLLKTPDEGHFQSSMNDRPRGSRSNFSYDNQRCREEFFANKQQAEENRRRVKGFEHTPRGSEDEMHTFGSLNHEEIRPRERTNTREEPRERTNTREEPRERTNTREEQSYERELQKAHQQAAENRRFAKQKQLEATEDIASQSKSTPRRSNVREEPHTFGPQDMSAHNGRMSPKEPPEVLVVPMFQMAGKEDDPRKRREQEQLALLEEARRENAKMKRELMEKHGKRSTYGEKIGFEEDEEQSTAAPTESDEKGELLVFDFRSPGGRDRGSPASATPLSSASGPNRTDRNSRSERAQVRQGDVSDPDGHDSKQFGRYRPEMWPCPEGSASDDAPSGDQRSSVASRSSNTRKSVDEKPKPKASQRKSQEGKTIEQDLEAKRILEERKKKQEEARQDFYRQKKAAEAAKRKKEMELNPAPVQRTRESKIEFSGVDIKQISHEDEDQFHAVPSPKDGWYVIRDGVPDDVEHPRSHSVPAFGYEPDVEEHSKSYSSQPPSTRSRSAPVARSQDVEDPDEDQEGSFPQARSREPLNAQDERGGFASSTERRSNPLMKRQVPREENIIVPDDLQGNSSASSSAKRVEGAENSRKPNPLFKSRKQPEPAEDLSHTQRARNLAGQLFSPSADLSSPSHPSPQGQSFKLPTSSAPRQSRETSEKIAAVREAMKAVNEDESEGLTQEGVFVGECQLRTPQGDDNEYEDEDEEEEAAIDDDDMLFEEGEEEDEGERDWEVPTSQMASPMRSPLLDVDECY